MKKMGYRDRRSLNITLLIIIIVIIVIIALAVIITNAIINHWDVFQILLAIGVTLVIIGSIGITSSFAGGHTVTSFAAHGRYPELGWAESKYAWKRRQKVPIISIILMVIGFVFVIIGIHEIL